VIRFAYEKGGSAAMVHVVDVLVPFLVLQVRVAIARWAIVAGIEPLLILESVLRLIEIAQGITLEVCSFG
jgi:hypothetical protein